MGAQGRDRPRRWTLAEIAREVGVSPVYLTQVFQQVKRCRSIAMDETIEAYLRPLVRTEQRTRDFQRFLAAFDCKHTVAVEGGLRQLKAPTLIVWGTDHVYFDVRWARWLAETIPGTRRRIELHGARIFFPAERAAEFNQDLRAHWSRNGG